MCGVMQTLQDYGQEPGDNPNAAHSRYGYIITFAGVPLCWKSQLIQEICYSTVQAKYVGMCNAMKALVPLCGLVDDILIYFKQSLSSSTIHCIVYEDNQGAYLLITNQRVSSRTKHFCIKHHWFWSHVHHPGRRPDGWVVVLECSTELMNVDYLTKCPARVIFQANRKHVQGW